MQRGGLGALEEQGEHVGACQVNMSPERCGTKCDNPPMSADVSELDPFRGRVTIADGIVAARRPREVMVVHRSDQDFGKHFIRKSPDGGEGVQMTLQIQNCSQRRVDVVQDRLAHVDKLRVLFLFCRSCSLFRFLIAIAYSPAAC